MQRSPSRPLRNLSCRRLRGLEKWYSWLGSLVQQRVLEAINERVRGCHGGASDETRVIDFLVVLFGYEILGERTLEAFYQRLQPFADPFMALFGRDRQPVRSTLSRFLAALTSEPVDTLRSLFLDDLLSRPLSKEKQTGGLADRAGNTWVVFDSDGTREAARKPALPQTEALPPPFRRLDDVCAAFLHWAQARASGAYPHGHQPGSQLSMARLVWQSRERELPNGTAPGPRLDHALSHGTPTPTGTCSPPARRTIWHRGRALRSGWILVRDPWQRVQRARSSSRPGASASAPRSASTADSKARWFAASTIAQRYPWGPRVCCAAWSWPPIQPARKRVQLASRVRASFTNSSSRRSHNRHSLLLTSLSCICIAGHYAPALSDEDREIDPDRWCSHSAWGQECWQVVSQWVWNLRLELGHQLAPEPLRTTEAGSCGVRDQRAAVPYLWL